MRKNSRPPRSEFAVELSFGYPRFGRHLGFGRSEVEKFDHISDLARIRDASGRFSRNPIPDLFLKFMSVENIVKRYN